MSLEPNNTKYFDVVGSGYVSEHHTDERHRNLLGSEKNAVGGAMAWLVFYAIALVVVIVANFQKVADLVVAATN